MTIKNNIETNDIRELTSDELGHVSGGFSILGYARGYGRALGIFAALSNGMILTPVAVAGFVVGAASVVASAAASVYNALKFW